MPHLAPMMATSIHTGKKKTVRKKRVLKEEQHKVIVVGDSHARKCATELGQLLNNDFEVLGFVNPGSGMKYIKDTPGVKLQQLSKKDVLVLFGGAPIT
jgi:hypothetical protein